MDHKILTTQLSFEWVTTLIAALTAFLGGLVSYLRSVVAGSEHSFMRAFVHMTTSGFSGLMCWLGCVQFEVPPAMTAICTGLAGHMGAEFIKIVEERFKERIMSTDFKIEKKVETFPVLDKRRATDLDPNAQPSGQNLGRRKTDGAANE